jgi:hypothetical protein
VLKETVIILTAVAIIMKRLTAIVLFGALIYLIIRIARVKAEESRQLWNMFSGLVDPREE